MENGMELIILIVFLLLGALGSLTNQKNDKKSSTDVDWETPPPQMKSSVPPLTPIHKPGKVWGEIEPTRDEMASSVQEPVMQQKRKLEKRTQRPLDETEPRPIPPSAPVPPFVTAAPPAPPARPRSMLEEIFREAFNYDDSFEKTPEPSVREFSHPEEPSLEAPRILAPAAKKRAKYKISSPVTVPMRPIPSVLERLAKETEANPLRSAVIFSEILRRPIPLMPMPKERTPADHAS